MNNEDISQRIAVIGMAGRFPRAANIDEYWKLIAEGHEGVRFFDDDELRGRGVPEDLIANPDYVKAAGIIDDFDRFDAAYFCFTPTEAQASDPQQRILLECAVTALENAGYPAGKHGRRVGVFCGVTRSNYLLHQLMRNRDFLGKINHLQTIIASDKSFAATQISYKLDLDGPSMAVDTACSTSLVAIHQACQSLLSYECDMALAGGASVAMPSQTGHLYQQGGIFSPDGHCRPFDFRARGTVRGAGAGVVVLKRLEDAIADGDTIDAVILASAINNDGAQKVGFTAPSVIGQRRVIETVHSLAGIPADTIGLIEAHGTGTALGDPIEIAALTDAFRRSTQANQFCAIGSVKGNIGHLDAAAGVAGFIKAVLALKHKQLPPSLNFERENAEIEFDKTPFIVSTTLRDWSARGAPRRAGVSAFGIGGTNAHVLLEEAPTQQRGACNIAATVLPLSAESSSALEAIKGQLVEALKRIEPAESAIGDIAATLQMGRKAHRYRYACVCRTVSEAIDTLGSSRSQTLPAFSRDEDKPEIVFLFPGQGTQYFGMARPLYRANTLFRQTIDHCAEKLRVLLDYDLRDVMVGEGRCEDGADALLEQTRYAQPALFVVEYSLAKLLQDWGIVPDVMIGHSLGELVAATVAGVFSLDDALTVVAERGRLMHDAPPGAMLAVNITEAELQDYLADGCELAAINGPDQLVLAGSAEAIDTLEEKLSKDFISTKRLKTAHAFHSSLMESVLDKFEHVLGRMTLRPPEIAVISNVTGNKLLAADACDPSYWARHIRQTVRFSDAIKEIGGRGSKIAVEVGPGKVLASFVQTGVFETRPTVVGTMIGGNTNGDGHDNFLQTLAALWAAGAPVNWSRLHAGKAIRRVHLPTYPFEGKRHWVESTTVVTDAVTPNKDASGALLYEPSWVREPLPSTDTEEQMPGTRRVVWLVFESGRWFSDFIRTSRSGEVVSVRPANTFAEHGPHTFDIRPASPEDHVRLLDALCLTDGCVVRIAHFWSTGCRWGAPVDNNGMDIPGPDMLALKALSAAISQLSVEPAVDLAWFTSATCDVTGAETIVPEKAMTRAFCTVLSQEIPCLRALCIDVDVMPDQEPAASVSLAHALLNEFSGEMAGGSVAYRLGRRWRAEFRRANCNATDGRRNLLKDGGVYLITGGLGQIGLALAEFLIREYGARVALVSRNPLPDQASWESLLSDHDCDAGLRRRIEMMRSLNARGEFVKLYIADVADASEMEEVVADVRCKFGTLNGVFHAAASVSAESFKLAVDTSIEHLREQCKAKVTGLHVLARILEKSNVDFCLLFSSISTIVGGIGFGAYAAANAYMDAFTEMKEREANSLRWVSVDLDAWMSDNPRLCRQGQHSKDFQSALSTESGLNALRNVLNGTSSCRVIVSSVEIDEHISRSRCKYREEIIAHDIEKPAVVEARPDLSVAYYAPEDDVESMLVDLWEELLGISGIGTRDPFVELGGHSLSAMQIITRVRKEFGVAIPLHVFFRAPTVTALARYIVDEALASADEQEVRMLMAEAAENSNGLSRQGNE